MRTRPIERVLTIALALALACASAWPASAAMAATAPSPERSYDPGRLATVTGTVEAVVRTRASGARAAGVRIHVRTAEGTVPVEVGPTWWSDRQPFQFRRGDRVAVTGSQAVGRGLIAGTIVPGADETIALRDEAGRPIWDGWRRR